MPAETPIAIHRSPWPGKQAGSPTLAPGTLGLAVKLLPATAEEGATIALLGFARVPGSIGDLYGGRLAGALQIVAIELATGAAYTHHAEGSHLAPLSAILANPPSATPGVRRVSSEFYFNLDLCDQLGLPPKAADYAVFAWLDDLVSPVQTVTIPAAPNRPGRPHAPALLPVPGLIEWTRASGSDSPAGRRLSLTLGDAGHHPRLIKGSIGPLAQELLEQHGPGPVRLTILFLDAMQRTVTSHVVALPANAHDFPGFEINAAAAFRAAGVPAKIFAIAAIGIRVSNAVCIESPR